MSIKPPPRRVTRCVKPGMRYRAPEGLPQRAIETGPVRRSDHLQRRVGHPCPRTPTSPTSGAGSDLLLTVKKRKGIPWPRRRWRAGAGVVWRAWQAKRDAPRLQVCGGTRGFVHGGPRRGDVERGPTGSSGTWRADWAKDGRSAVGGVYRGPRDTGRPVLGASRGDVCFARLRLTMPVWRSLP